MSRFSPRALLFDMDGLLVDSEPLWFEVERAFVRARRADAEWTRAMWRACIGRGMRTTLETMGATFGFEVDLGRDAGAIGDSFCARTAELALKPGARELLDFADEQGLVCALASSSASPLVGAVLARFDLAPRFRAVVSGSDVARPKPAPDIFLAAAARLGAPPRACLVLEDSIAGVEAARAAEMTCIAVPDASAPAEGHGAFADAVVRDLFEAAGLLVRSSARV